MKKKPNLEISVMTPKMRLAMGLPPTLPNRHLAPNEKIPIGTLIEYIPTGMLYIISGYEMTSNYGIGANWGFAEVAVAYGQIKGDTINIDSPFASTLWKIYEKD